MQQFMLPSIPAFSQRILSPPPTRLLLSALPLPSQNIHPTQLPPNHHLVHFTHPTTPDQLSEDGYILTDAPPQGHYRRMWASGSLTFSPRNLHFSDYVQERIQRVNVEEKKGKIWTWFDREYRHIIKDQVVDEPDIVEQRCLVYIPFHPDALIPPFQRRFLQSTLIFCSRLFLTFRTIDV